MHGWSLERSSLFHLRGQSQARIQELGSPMPFSSAFKTRKEPGSTEERAWKEPGSTEDRAPAGQEPPLARGWRPGDPARPAGHTGEHTSVPWVPALPVGAPRGSLRWGKSKDQANPEARVTRGWPASQAAVATAQNNAAKQGRGSSSRRLSREGSSGWIEQHFLLPLNCD